MGELSSDTEGVKSRLNENANDVEAEEPTAETGAEGTALSNELGVEVLL